MRCKVSKVAKFLGSSLDTLTVEPSFLGEYPKVIIGFVLGDP